MAKKPGRMAPLGKSTVSRTDAELADTEAQVLQTTQVDWEALRPQVTGQDVYDQLIAAVKESTAQNENLAQLRARIEALGSEGVAFAKRVLKLLP